MRIAHFMRENNRLAGGGSVFASGSWQLGRILEAARRKVQIILASSRTKQRNLMGDWLDIIYSRYATLLIGSFKHLWLINQLTEKKC